MSTRKGKNSDDVPERLLQLMESRGLSKAQLARELGVSNAHVANWLSGQLPRADQMLTIGRHFGVTIEWLLTGQPDPPPRAAEPSVLKQARAEAEKLFRQLVEVEETTKRLRAFLG